MKADDRSDAGEPPGDVFEVWQLRLYVVGGARNSAQALSHLRAILDTYVPDRYELEIVDILHDPERALTDGILLTPTLIKLAPLPAARLVGNLSESERVIWALGLPPQPADARSRGGAKR